MNKWVVKDGEKREYKSSMGKTDYNIPMFGYKASFFVCLVIFAAVMIVPSVMNSANRLAVLTVCSIVIGTAISYAQYFMNSDIGMGKRFVVLAIVMSILIWLMLISL